MHYWTIVPFLTPLVWRDRDATPRPTAPEADALTTRLSGPVRLKEYLKFNAKSFAYLHRPDKCLETIQMIRSTQYIEKERDVVSGRIDLETSRLEIGPKPPRTGIGTVWRLAGICTGKVCVAAIELSLKM